MNLSLKILIIINLISLSNKQKEKEAILKETVRTGKLADIVKKKYELRLV